VLSYGFIVLYPAQFSSPGLLPIASLEEAVRTTIALRVGLLLGAAGLLLSFLSDLLVRRMRSGEGRTPEPRVDRDRGA
jgi:hypothetical protein